MFGRVPGYGRGRSLTGSLPVGATHSPRYAEGPSRHLTRAATLPPNLFSSIFTSMKLFLNRAERLRYLGFDDRLMVVILIPLVAVIAAVIIHPSLPDAPDGSNMVLSCYLISLLYTSVYWVVIRSIIIYLRYRIPRQDRLMRRLSLLFFSSLAVVLFFNVLIDRLLVWIFPSLEASADDLPSFTVSLVVSVLLCALVSSIYEFIYFLFKYRQSLIEQERLARANMQAQLSALKQQVNPHFLFNSLNTLANIIPEDQALATRFVQRLAAVYRRLLEYRHEDTISAGRRTCRATRLRFSTGNPF